MVGQFQLRYFGPRALIEDNSRRSKGTTLALLRAGYRFNKDVKLAIEIVMVRRYALTISEPDSTPTRGPKASTAAATPPPPLGYPPCLIPRGVAPGSGQRGAANVSRLPRSKRRLSLSQGSVHGLSRARKAPPSSLVSGISIRQPFLCLARIGRHDLA